jgi:hypothetical protein
MTTFLQHDRVLHQTEKGGERVKQQRDRVLQRVTACAINFTIGENIYDSYRRILSR